MIIEASLSLNRAGVALLEKRGETAPKVRAEGILEKTQIFDARGLGVTSTVRRIMYWSHDTKVLCLNAARNRPSSLLWVRSDLPL